MIGVLGFGLSATVALVGAAYFARRKDWFAAGAMAGLAIANAVVAAAFWGAA